MTAVGFIGLGIMGSPMAVHLAEAGYTVNGYNRTPDKAKPLVDAGGTAAGSVAEAVAGADVVAVMVPDSADVEDVLTGDDGVLAHAPAGGPSSSTSQASGPTSRHALRSWPRARASEWWTPPSPAVKPVRRTRRCRSWWVAAPRTSRPPDRCSTW